MERDPSIHIKRSDLYHILNNVLTDIDESLIENIMRQARKVSLSNRAILVTRQKTREKVDKIKSSSIGDAILMADILYATRIQLKHIGVKKITMADRAWPDVKALVPIVNEYCEVNDLEYRQGYISYITTGFELMKQQKKTNHQFAAKWMAQRSDTILSVLNGKQALQNDDSPEDTKSIHDLYVKEVAERTGIYQRFLDKTENLIHFIEAKKQANETNAPYEIYIEAQFYALEFCNGIPRIEDLYGAKASSRLINYVSKKGINLESVKETPEIDWSNFKR